METLFDRAMGQRDRNELEDAITTLRELVARSSERDHRRLLVHAHLQLGHVFDKLGDSVAREHHMRLATELAPRFELASLAQFHALLALGRMEDAMHEMVRFLECSDSLDYRALLSVGFDDLAPPLQALVERARRLLEAPRVCPRIYADFNGLMGSPRIAGRSMVPLDTWGSLRDLSNAGIRLHEGLPLVIHDASDETEDLEARAVAYYDSARAWWYAEFETYEYVPARDRLPVTSFRCLDCRADLAQTNGSFVTTNERCPSCGLSVRAAITPPEMASR